MSLIPRRSARRRQKTSREVLNEAEREGDFQDKVRQLAELKGWLVYHTHDSRRSDEGFPDLVMSRDRVVFAELKSEKGKLSEKQLEWVAGLRDLAGAEVYVFRPSDWDRVVEVLN
jgi:hypothetical protein